MKTLTLIIIVLSCCIPPSQAQIQMSSIDLKVPELRVSKSDPHLVIIIDSIEFELVGLSQVDSVKNTTTYVYNNVDVNWIKAISSNTKSGKKSIKELRLNEDLSIKEDDVKIISLHKHNIKDFLEGKTVETPLTLKKYN